MPTISEKITALRKTANLTQEALGGKLGVTGQAVSKWEKGDSMPDILILPNLCRALGCSLEYLLTDEPKSVTSGDIVQDFCSYAREHGRSEVLLDVISRLFYENGNKISGGGVLFGSENLLMYMKDTFGFAAQNYRETLYSQSPEDIAYYLRILTDEACLKILFCTSADEAVTDKELMEKTGLDEAAVDRILLGLMKRNILCSAADNSGKRGYLQCAEAAGVYMILAGCCISGCGDSDKINGFPGEWWFIRGVD